MLIQNNYFCEDSFSILKVKKRKLKIFFFGISKRAGKNQNQHADSRIVVTFITENHLRS